MNKYFAYGSNLCPKQMKRRCPESSHFGVARLSEYKLIFPYFCERWNGGNVELGQGQKGGVASIKKCNDSYVEGMIYNISDEELLMMDKYERVHEKTYFRKKIIVKDSVEKNIECWTYFVTIPDDAGFSPSPFYIDTIISGAKRHGLSGEYIESLSNIEKYKQ